MATDKSKKRTPRCGAPLDLELMVRGKGKRVLITAGPTWVAIDEIRVISNQATGTTGIHLAQALQKKGAEVTLLLGPHTVAPKLSGVKIIRFQFFDELRAAVKQELRRKKYGIILHAAAVSDFAPKYAHQGKLASGKAHTLRLVPLPKIINDITASVPEAKVVMFKLETKVSDTMLVKRGRAALLKSGADIVVANRLNPYKAFVLNNNEMITTASSKNELIKKLSTLVYRL